MSVRSARRNLLPTNNIEESSPTNTTQPTSTKTTFNDKFQYLGILAMIILIITIGFQMADPDVYADINKKELITINTNTNKSIATPSPIEPIHPPGIEVIVHEDDGDVEIDVPQQIPPDLIEHDSQELNSSVPISNKQKSIDMRNQLLERVRQRSRPPPKQMQNNTTANYKYKYNHKSPPRGKRSPGGGSLINIKTPYHDANKNIVLPSIEHMSENSSRRFYSAIDEPAKIFGYDFQCNKEKCAHSLGIISGLYNTGTNVAYRLINPNCRTKLLFQPGWGKHEMFDDKKIQHFNENDYPGSPKGLYDYNKSMLIVVIKDPLTWMKSMCKANYDFRYFNRTWFFHSCPTGLKHSGFDWIPMNRGKVMNLGKNKTSNGVYDSPIHLWNEWYSSAVNNVDGSRWKYVIVRFEDLLFRVQSVVKQFCKCLGQCDYKKGVSDEKIKIADAPSKPHGNPRNRTMSFWAYSTPEYRYEGYTKEDLEYMLDALNGTLLEMFGYEFNVEKTLRMRL